MNSTKKYEYQVSESAPLNFPMEIVSGSLIFHDGSGSLYVPSKVVVANGWGEWRSSHVLDNDGYPLPKKLELVFFSYIENQFYKGSFDLPLKDLEKLFGQGYYSHREETDVTYNQFIVGLAPGGKVSIWINSLDRKTEVFFGEAKKIEGDWEWIVDNPEVSRKQIIQEVLEDELESKETLKRLEENGIPYGLWDKYHSARYLWKPTLNGMKLRDNIIDNIIFFNGEEIYKGLSLPSNIDNDLAVPKEIHIMWNRTGYLVNDLKIECFFDEEEIFNAFELVAKDNLPIDMEFRMEPEKNYDFTIWLRTEKSDIELKNTKIKTWKPGGMRYENAGPKDKE